MFTDFHLMVFIGCECKCGVSVRVSSALTNSRFLVFFFRFPFSGAVELVGGNKGKLYTHHRIHQYFL